MKTIKVNMLDIAGGYKFKSPYHNKTKWLPFNIESDGYVSTVEYKGWTPYLRQGFYTRESLDSLINSGYIQLGKAAWPKSLKREEI